VKPNLKKKVSKAAHLVLQATQGRLDVKRFAGTRPDHTVWICNQTLIVHFK